MDHIFLSNLQVIWPVATTRDFSEFFTAEKLVFFLLHDGMVPYTVYIKFLLTPPVFKNTKIALLNFKDKD
jgi:hypothetical protein